MLRCWACNELLLVDQEATDCGACAHRCHLSCLSEEGEDGPLCNGCREECSECLMPVLRDMTKSNHFIACPSGDQVRRCPEYRPPRLKPTHDPQIFSCFTRAEAGFLRTEIERVIGAEAGVFNVSGLEHVAEFIGNRVIPIIRAVPDQDTYKFRMRPTTQDGIDLHMDLNYILNHMQDPNTCLNCGGHLSEKQSLQQRGLHLRKVCKKVPRVVRAFTIAGNIGPKPIAFLSFGPPCNAARNATGMIVPVTNHRTTVVPCMLAPGEIVVFSSHTLHRSTIEALDGNRWSFDMRVLL
jgi:hypothetical protein